MFGLSAGALFEDVDKTLRQRFSLNERALYKLRGHCRRIKCRDYGHGYALVYFHQF